MRALPALIAAANPLQAPWMDPARIPRVPAKEWYHFCVVAPGLELIVNFNLGTDLRPAAHGGRIARLIVLVRQGGWMGAVETMAASDVHVAAQGIHLVLGQSRLRFEDGAFHLFARLREQPISLALRLEPLAMPLRSRGATLGDGTLSWLVVPALRATGTVRVGASQHRLENAPAYHDHNWGTWRWGSDFAWQWGFALPTRHDGWSIVYSRVTDRARTKDLDRKLCLWREGRLVRLFSERDVDIRPEGYLRDTHVRRFPPPMALLVPGTATDVPRDLFLTARSGDDHLSLRFQARDVAQLVIPNETDLGVTLISEVCGQVSLEGQVQGQPLVEEGSGVFEHVHPG